MTWILTQSGQQFDLLRPTASMIKPVDIAHALSRLCRFNGHTRAHYSVAQHSLIVASLGAVQSQEKELIAEYLSTISIGKARKSQDIELDLDAQIAGMSAGRKVDLNTGITRGGDDPLWLPEQESAARATERA